MIMVTRFVRMRLLRKMTVAFHKNLFASNNNLFTLLPFRGAFLIIEQNMLNNFQMTFTDEDIKFSTFNMGPFKALRLDDLHAIVFYS